MSVQNLITSWFHLYLSNVLFSTENTQCHDEKNVISDWRDLWNLVMRLRDLLTVRNMPWMFRYNKVNKRDVYFTKCPSFLVNMFGIWMSWQWMMEMLLHQKHLHLQHIKLRLSFSEYVKHCKNFGVWGQFYSLIHKIDDYNFKSHMVKGKRQ